MPSRFLFVKKPNRLDVHVFNDDSKINLEKTKDNIQLMLNIVAKTVESAKKAE